MKKIFVLVLIFFLVLPIDSFSQEKKHKTEKSPNIEQTSKKRAKSKKPPKKKSTQKRGQKSRIKNHDQKKTNNMWKR